MQINATLTNPTFLPQLPSQSLELFYVLLMRAVCDLILLILWTFNWHANSSIIKNSLWRSISCFAVSSMLASIFTLSEMTHLGKTDDFLSFLSVIRLVVSSLPVFAQYYTMQLLSKGVSIHRSKLTSVEMRTITCNSTFMSLSSLAWLAIGGGIISAVLIFWMVNFGYLISNFRWSLFKITENIESKWSEATLTTDEKLGIDGRVNLARLRNRVAANEQKMSGLLFSRPNFDSTPILDLSADIHGKSASTYSIIHFYVLKRLAIRLNFVLCLSMSIAYLISILALFVLYPSRPAVGEGIFQITTIVVLCAWMAMFRLRRAQILTVVVPPWIIK